MGSSLRQKCNSPGQTGPVMWKTFPCHDITSLILLLFLQECGYVTLCKQQPVASSHKGPVMQCFHVMSDMFFLVLLGGLFLQEFNPMTLQVPLPDSPLNPTGSRPRLLHTHSLVAGGLAVGYETSLVLPFQQLASLNMDGDNYICSGFWISCNALCLLMTGNSSHFVKAADSPLHNPKGRQMACL